MGVAVRSAGLVGRALSDRSRACLGALASFVGRLRGARARLVLGARARPVLVLLAGGRWRVSGWFAERAEALERGGELVGPWPGGWEAQRRDAGVEREAGGDVQ